MVILLKCGKTVFNALILRYVCVKGFDIEADKVVSRVDFLAKGEYYFQKVVGIFNVGWYLFDAGFKIKMLGI